MEAITEINGLDDTADFVVAFRLNAFLARHRFSLQVSEAGMTGWRAEVPG